MKLKFRAEAKILLYYYFALFLLYLVAIGVLNISSFTKIMRYMDLIHSAFTSEYFAPTMVFSCLH